MGTTASSLFFGVSFCVAVLTMARSGGVPVRPSVHPSVSVLWGGGGLAMAGRLPEHRRRSEAQSSPPACVRTRTCFLTFRKLAVVAIATVHRDFPSGRVGPLHWRRGFSFFGIIQIQRPNSKEVNAPSWPIHLPRPNFERGRRPIHTLRGAAQ